MVVGFVVVANFWDVNWVGRGSSGYTTNEVEWNHGVSYAVMMVGIYSPKKNNMEPESHPWFQRKIIFQTFIFVFQPLVF